VKVVASQTPASAGAFVQWQRTKVRLRLHFKSGLYTLVKKQQNEYQTDTYSYSAAKYK